MQLQLKLYRVCPCPLLHAAWHFRYLPEERTCRFSEPCLRFVKGILIFQKWALLYNCVVQPPPCRDLRSDSRLQFLRASDGSKSNRSGMKHRYRSVHDPQDSILSYLSVIILSAHSEARQFPGEKPIVTLFLGVFYLHLYGAWF